MSKQAVKVIIRTRPTDEFANRNLKINTGTGVSIFFNFTFYLRISTSKSTKKTKGMSTTPPTTGSLSFKIFCIMQPKMMFTICLLRKL
jgi:hypothetical protein